MKAAAEGGTFRWKVGVTEEVNDFQSPREVLVMFLFYRVYHF